MNTVSKCDWRMALTLVLLTTACSRMESSRSINLGSIDNYCHLAARTTNTARKTFGTDLAHQEKITVDWTAIFSPKADASRGLFGKVDTEQELIPQGSEFVVTLDRACAESDIKTGLSHQLLRSSGRVWPIQRVTLPWVLEQEMDRATFSGVVLDDNCLIQVSEQGEVTLGSDLQALEWQDPLSTSQGHLKVIGLDQAHEFFYQTNAIQEDIVIAIVDSGVDDTHPDLQDQMWLNELGQHGFDFVDIDTEPMDIDGHGTHVAGLIGARANNNVGTTGVMGTHVRLMAIRSLSAAGGVISGTIDGIVNGIQYAVDNGAQVINLSLGGYTSNATLRRALEVAIGQNVLIVAAAGNDNIDIGSGVDTFFSPAGYAKDLPGVISVASLDSSSRLLSSFSNYSSSSVEIAAPGSEDSQDRDFGLLSTFPVAMSPGASNAYQRFSGTSMAAPVVAGTLGLVLGYLNSKKIHFTADQMERFLLIHSDQMSSLRGAVKDGSSLNLRRIVSGLDALNSELSGDSEQELRCD